ncbi:Transposon Ty3-I Gag-Pol polyprotein [Vitis vinifera]|uniref:Transposon Ty3-I Gag-Pol polyprotein n=1 Tax=Vitis vinifera TaxID=29760 RepID=A0A438H6V1_VITVI|nr:Transposon Ty3-I Gag-Pol polyprotein [Vitis vinifera]
MHEVQAISETHAHVMPCTICQSGEHVVDECPTIPAVREILGDQANVVGPPPYQPQAQTLASQQTSSVEQAIVNLSKVMGDFIDNIQYSISRLTNLNTVNEKGKFPSQPSQNTKGVHEVETQNGESSKLREVKAVITLRNGKEVDQPLPKVRQDEELMSRRTLVKESNNQEEESGKKNASKSSIEKEPRIDLCTIKRGLNVTKKGFLTKQVSAIIQCKSPVKYKDPGCPTISVNIGGTHVEKALLDLGARTKLVPIILGRPFLATSNAIINCRNGVMQLIFGNMTLELNIFHLCKRHLQPEEEEGLEEVCLINTLVEEHCDKNLDENLNESLGVLEVGLPEPSEPLAIMSPWRRREDILPLFNEEDSKPAAREDPPKLVLKPLPVDLKYAYLEKDEQCPVVVSSTLTSNQEDSLLGVLRKCKKAIGWQISDLKWISPLVCTHHIYMEEDAKPVRQPQRRLNPHMQEVLVGDPNPSSPKEIWNYCDPDEKGEEVSTRLTSGWRVCINYKRLNSVTRKDHFPLPFMDQVLERVSGHHFYCFLNGYSGYFQIEIDLEDQEKTTFTCPFGTFAYRRMPFGLCNAAATFQRCMLSIFSDMVEHIMEVFMDDITVYGGSYKECLLHLEAILQRLKDGKFVWDEKCQKSFEELKQFLTTAPIVRAPNWKLPFEIMCDASDLAMGLFWAKRRWKALWSFIVVFTDHSVLKGVENVVVDHLSRLVIGHDSHGLPINDDFPEESLMSIEVAPWYSHIANYLIVGEVQDAHSMCKGCDRCQRLGKLTRRNMMPLNPILIVDVFDWVESIPCRSNDHKVVLKFLKENIFSRTAYKTILGMSPYALFMAKPAISQWRSRFLPLRQHTAILRQIQHQLGLPSATEHLIPTTAEPHAPPEPTIEDAETSA